MTSWTEEEKSKFIEGLKKYGKDANKISQLLPTRTIYAIKKRFMTLKKHLICNPDSLDQDILPLLKIYKSKNRKHIPMQTRPNESDSDCRIQVQNLPTDNEQNNDWIVKHD